MTQQRTTLWRGLTVALAVVAFTAVAAALRFWRLGAWSLDSDETFTLRDSIVLRIDNPRPLFYFLNHYLVAPFHPLDEWGLRLLPAAFGVLAIPVVYVVGRHLVGPRAACFAAVLLTFSPLHVYYSQFARYWSLVFLLCAVYPYVLYRGFRERDRGMLAFGSVLGVMATLAHPTSVLLVGAVGLWLVLTYLRDGKWRQSWNRQAVRRGIAVAGALLVAIGVRFVPMLEAWAADHRHGENTEFLLHLPGTHGIKQLAFLAAYTESLTLPLVLMGLLGIYLLRTYDRSLALFLTCVLVFPMAFLAPVSLIAPVSTFYLVPPIPALFFGAGAFLDRLTSAEWDLRPRWLLAATLVLLAVAAGAPTLVSQYRDGRRYDFRGVARWLNGQHAPGDVIFSDQPRALAHYLPQTTVQYLRGDPAPLGEALRDLATAGRGGALWVVSPAPAHAFRTNPKLGDLGGWLYTNCQLRNIVGVGRVDFRQYHLQVFRCPAATVAKR